MGSQTVEKKARSTHRAGFAHCKTPGDIHDRIKTAFGFPDYYGENWDALWDCLWEFALSQSETRHVFIRGLSQLSNEPQSYVREAIEIMGKLEKEYPIVSFTVLED